MEPESIPLYQQAFELADVGLAVLSPQGEWLLANAALAAMTGRAPAALHGSQAHATVFDAGIGAGIASLLAMPADARPARTVLESAPSDGEAADAAAWRVILTPLSGTQGGLLLECHDLAVERRRTQAAARLQEQLAHGLSHELRAPLRSIAGFASRLDESGAVREAERSDLGRIRAAAARADGLVQALLELLRASRQPMRAEVVDVSLLCEWVAAELQDAERDRAAQVEVAQGLWARGDEHWIRVMLQQVFDNAWKFSSDSAQVRIIVEGAYDGDRLRLSVRDQGRGFDMRYADKLFLPFQRLHGSNQGGGHGLGLAIARQVVERHGGRIHAWSQPGQGSTLIIELPAAYPGDAESRA